MKVFVTGADSCLANALLPMLCAESYVERVIGIDLKQARFAHPKFTSEVMDVRSEKLMDKLVGVDAVVHLGYAVMREKLSNSELYDNNVNGTLAVFEAAKRSGIAKVINMSSVSVYGSGKGLTESSPLNPAEVFTYARHKAEIEAISAHKYQNVVHIRSHLIFGKNSQKFLRDMINSNIYIRPPSPMPVLQVIHEADVAQAILLCLKMPASGVFNLAAPEVVTIPDLVRYQRHRVFPIPLSVVRGVVSAVKLLGSKDEFAWLEVMDTTLTVSSERARAVLGWQPRFSAWDAVKEMQKTA